MAVAVARVRSLRARTSALRAGCSMGSPNPPSASMPLAGSGHLDAGSSHACRPCCAGCSGATPTLPPAQRSSSMAAVHASGAQPSSAPVITTGREAAMNSERNVPGSSSAHATRSTGAQGMVSAMI